MKFFTKQTKKDWKGKGKKRREENKKLKKRIEELSISRDKWKEKYKKSEGKREEDKKNERDGL